MNPKEIAKLISEDIRNNNGLLDETNERSLYGDASHMKHIKGPDNNNYVLSEPINDAGDRQVYNTWNLSDPIGIYKRVGGKETSASKFQVGWTPNQIYSYGTTTGSGDKPEILKDPNIELPTSDALPRATQITGGKFEFEFYPDKERPNEPGKPYKLEGEKSHNKICPKCGKKSHVEKSSYQQGDKRKKVYRCNAKDKDKPITKNDIGQHVLYNDTVYKLLGIEENNYIIGIDESKPKTVNQNEITAICGYTWSPIIKFLKIQWISVGEHGEKILNKRQAGIDDIERVKKFIDAKRRSLDARGLGHLSRDAKYWESETSLAGPKAQEEWPPLGSGSIPTRGVRTSKSQINPEKLGL